MTDTRTVHDPFLKKDVEVSNRLVDRLRGKYACGPVQENGEPEFGWRQFDTPPIQHEAADEIERLSAIQPQRMPYPEPTREMLDGDPLFEAIWQAIKDWDISRHNNGVYSGPTGNDARHIYDAVSALTRPDDPPQRMRETLESARDYIASVNFYAAGTPAYIKNCEQLIAIDAALAHTRPECGTTENTGG